MRKTLSTVILALALVAAVAPVAVADTCCEPVTDAMATQDPTVVSGFAARPCETRRSVDCYWDAIAHTGQWGHSYFAIRVGRQVCIRYWDRKYDRRHGHCSPLHRHHRR